MWRGMDIAFSSKALRDMCESQDELAQTYGSHVATTLKTRLADLVAAESIYDLVAGIRSHVLRSKEERWTIALGEGFQMVLAANHARNPTSPGRTEMLPSSRPW